MEFNCCYASTGSELVLISKEIRGAQARLLRHTMRIRGEYFVEIKNISISHTLK